MKNPLENVKLNTYEFNGIYRAVVVDNNDPKQQGRVRLRIYGIHNEDKNLLPDKALPWAEAATDLIGGGSQGKGLYAIPENGSHIWIFFEAGNHMYPVYFASAVSKPTSLNSGLDSNNIGFVDANEPERVNEPDWSRIARSNNADEPAVNLRNSQKISNIIDSVGGSWSEPSRPPGAVYPNDNVLELKSGFTIEMDESLTSQNRLTIWHPMNSFFEIDYQGQIILKSSNNVYNLFMRSFNKLVIENYRFTCQGNEMIYINGNRNIKTDGNHIENINSNETKTVAGNGTETYQSSKTKNIAQSETISIGANRTTNIAGMEVLQAAGGNLTFSGPLNIQATAITLSAPIISLNSGVAVMTLGSGISMIDGTLIKLGDALGTAAAGIGGRTGPENPGTPHSHPLQLSSKVWV